MASRSESIREFLRTTAPSGRLEELVEASGVEAAGFPDQRRQVLEKLETGQELNAREQFFAEAIIIPDRRPAVDIKDGTYTVRHADWISLNEDGPRHRLERTFASIGRVELPGHPKVPYGGTAFMVGPNLLMTNRHVAELFANGLGTRGLHFIPGRAAGVDFLRERETLQHTPVAVVELVLIHPYWDMALFRIEGADAHREPLPLTTAEVDGFIGQDVVVVGYPAFDSRNPVDVQEAVFGGVYGVKRLLPGKLNGRASTESYDRVVRVPTHDSSTLGGNSGSCVVAVATGEVIALHFAGRYLKTNFCVAASDLARDGRVIDAGVHFSGSLVRGRVPYEDAWRAADRAHTAADAPAPGPEVRGVAAAATPAPSAGEARITIPLEITVRLGAANLCASVGAAAPTPERAGERPPPGKPFHDEDYTTRRGYDADFLGIPVPLPTPRDPDALLTVDGGKSLHYHHFSLFMHRARRLAALSAANVDASEAAKTPGNRPPGDYTRDGLAGRSSDAWMQDPRIAASEQLAETFFEKDRQSFDKGHVVRRDDVAWGATYEEMRNANGDSFHVTNCAPQVAIFNRSDHGPDNWGDLENLIMEQADSERLQVFGGPVFRDDDPVFNGVDHAGPVSVTIPRRYWKLVVARKAGALQAFGFLLEQDLSDVDFEFAVPGRWLPFTAPVGEIEDFAGFDFAPAIRNADRFGSEEAVAIAAAGAPRRREAGGGRPSPDTAAAAIADILALWRQEQERAAGDGGAADQHPRFVVELARPLTDGTIEAMLGGALGLELRVGPLFGGDEELDRFRAVDVPGVRDADRPDLFDVARAMQAILDAASVEPDLDTRYFDADPALPPEEGTAESANFAFWCWADDDRKPADPDWAVKKTRLAEAWARSEAEGRPARGRGSVIFQPDTGVVTTHPDVPPGIWDDPRGANFIERGQRPIDPMVGSGNLGHGTATGSVAASPLGDKMRGAAPEAALIPVRCLRSVVRFNQSLVAEAVDHARRNGAHVISMSLGGVPSSALQAAVRKAVRENVIVLAAAGNCVGSVIWPARYSEVIAVGGVNSADRPWQGSSRGSSVDFSAPAEFVLRADARDPSEPDKAEGGQGTSFAVALLAGVAACWLAHHGRDALIAGLGRSETLQDLFRRAMRASARVPPGFATSEYGAGIVDADELLAADPAAVRAEEAVVAVAPVRVEDQVRELFAEMAGEGEAEAASYAMRDPLSVLELACVGLDRARYRNPRQRTLEAEPPPDLSRGLKAMAGPAVTRKLMRGAGR